MATTTLLMIKRSIVGDPTLMTIICLLLLLCTASKFKKSQFQNLHFFNFQKHSILLLLKSF